MNRTQTKKAFVECLNKQISGRQDKETKLEYSLDIKYICVNNGIHIDGNYQHGMLKDWFIKRFPAYFKPHQWYSKITLLTISVVEFEKIYKEVMSLDENKYERKVKSAEKIDESNDNSITEYTAIDINNEYKIAKQRGLYGIRKDDQWFIEPEFDLSQLLKNWETLFKNAYMIHLANQ